MTNLSSFCWRAEIKYKYMVNTSTVAIALIHCDEAKAKADQVQHGSEVHSPRSALSGRSLVDAFKLKKKITI